jgi:myo-inositol-1(or 4)-monophosphatase
MTSQPHSNTTPDERRALCDLAETLALEAGDLALAGRRAGLSEVRTKSTATDMVTEFDHVCENVITNGLRNARPHDAIVGEEGASDQGTSGLTWYIDPIDGTTNFYFDLPNWAVSIGVVDDEGPLAGAVYVPALGEMFTGARGLGAFMNGERISVRDNDIITDALVCTGFSYAPERRLHQARRVAQLAHKVRDIRRFGAAAIDLCFVACGRLDAYFEEYLHPWDLVAGGVIATEAGAVITNFSGGEMEPREVLASTPGVHSALVALLAEANAAIDNTDSHSFL